MSQREALDLLPGVPVRRRGGALVEVGARIKAWTGLEPGDVLEDPEALLARVAPASVGAVRAAWAAQEPTPPFWLSDEGGCWRRVIEFAGDEGWAVWLESERVAARACRALELRRLGQMAGGVVHEVNNPLAGVLNYVRVARRIAKDDEQLEEFLGGAESEAERILGITKVLTELTPRPAGEVEHPVAPSAVLRRVLLLTRTQLRDAGLRYRVEPCGDLPALRDVQHATLQAILGVLEDTTLRASSGTEVVLSAEARPGGVGLIVRDGVERPARAELGAAGFGGATQTERALAIVGGSLIVEPGQVVLVFSTWTD